MASIQHSIRDGVAAARVRAALVARGSTMRAWALHHGYPPVSVYCAVNTWARRPDKRPHGGQARRIIAQLRDDLGADVVPEPTAPERVGSAA